MMSLDEQLEVEAEVEKRFEQRIDKLQSELTRCYMYIITRQYKGPGGQMITGFTCFRCNQQKSHSDTGVPVICPECEKEIRKSWAKANIHEGNDE